VGRQRRLRAQKMPPHRANDPSTRAATARPGEREAAEKESAAQRRRAADARVSADAQRRERDRLRLKPMAKARGWLTSSPISIVNDGRRNAGGRDVGLAVEDGRGCGARLAQLTAARVTLVQESSPRSAWSSRSVPRMSATCATDTRLVKGSLMPLLYSSPDAPWRKHSGATGALSEWHPSVERRNDPSDAEQKLGDSALVDASAAHVGARRRDSVFMGSMRREEMSCSLPVSLPHATVQSSPRKSSTEERSVARCLGRDGGRNVAKAGDASEAVTSKSRGASPTNDREPTPS
jgi:hypothetical protein